MSALVVMQNVQTMSSREIATLCDKDIGHVHRDIRVILCQLKDDPDLHHLKESKDSRGYVQEYFLPKSLTMTVVMGYSIQLRKRVIDRWQELEAKVANPFKVPSTLSEALRLAADQQEAIEAQQARLAVAEPKAAALDAISMREGYICISSAAKNIGVQMKTLVEFLLQKKWLFRHPRNQKLRAYAKAIEGGFVTEKTIAHGEYQDSQAVLTPKGLTVAATHFESQKQQQY